MTERIEISRRLVFVNAASSVLRQVLGLSVLLWALQYLLGRLDDEEFKLYPVLTAVMAFVPILTALLTTGLGRYVTEAYARGDMRRVSELTSTAFLPLVAAALGVLAVGGTVAWRVEAWLHVRPQDVGDARLMLGLLLFGSALQLLSAPFGLGFYLRQRFVLRNGIGLGVELLRVGLLAALLLGVSASVRWLVVANVTGSLVELAVVVTLSRRMEPALCFRPSLVRLEHLRALTGYGSWTVLSRLAGMIRESSDRLLLNQFATATDVNAFHVGATFDVNLRRLVFGASGTAQPALTAMHATGQDARLRATYRRLSRWFLGLLLVGGLPLVIFRREFLDLYLDQRAGALGAASTVLALLVGRYLFLFPNAAIGALAVARAEVRALAVRALSIELVNLALTFYLVAGRGMGARGSALSTFLVTVFLYPPLFWSLGARLAGTDVRSWWLAAAPRVLAVAAVGAGVLLLMQRLVPATTWGRLGLDAGIGVLVMGVLGIRFALEPADRARLVAFLRRARLVGPPADG